MFMELAHLQLRNKERERVFRDQPVHSVLRSNSFGNRITSFLVGFLKIFPTTVMQNVLFVKEKALRSNIPHQIRIQLCKLTLIDSTWLLAYTQVKSTMEFDFQNMQAALYVQSNFAKKVAHTPAKNLVSKTANLGLVWFTNGNHVKYLQTSLWPPSSSFGSVSDLTITSR